MLGGVGGVISAEGPAGASAAKADLADVSALAEGDDASRERRVAVPTRLRRNPCAVNGHPSTWLGGPGVFVE